MKLELDNNDLVNFKRSLIDQDSTNERCFAFRSKLWLRDDLDDA